MSNRSGLLQKLLLIAAVAASTVGHAQVAGQAAAAADAAAKSPEATAPAAALPILGLAQVTVIVSDLGRSRHFYGDVLGLPMAFELKDKSGAVASVYFKVNDDQYVELVPGLRPDNLIRQQRLVIQSDNLVQLRGLMVARGLDAGPINTGPDGNPVFRITAPNGFPLDFMQYAPGSRQEKLRGKLLSSKRISTHLWHAGTMSRDDTTRAFFQNLGWGRLLPGSRGELIETPSSDRNLETKNPPLDPANPATLDRYNREVYGAVYHFALEIDDMHAARETLKQRGGLDDVRLRTAVGNNRHWLIHLFDPDGSRVELMSKDTVADNIPAFSVMPPGPPASPILATEKGVYPWP